MKLKAMWNQWLGLSQSLKSAQAANNLGRRWVGTRGPAAGTGGRNIFREQCWEEQGLNVLLGQTWPFQTRVTLEEIGVLYALALVIQALHLDENCELQSFASHGRWCTVEKITTLSHLAWFWGDFWRHQWLMTYFGSSVILIWFLGVCIDDQEQMHYIQAQQCVPLLCFWGTEFTI